MASVGWSILNLEQNRIEDLGVRVFPKSEDRSANALNTKRRESRLTRRTIRRKKGRLQAVKDLFVKEGLIDIGERDQVFTTSKGQIDVWQLRKEGLDRLLTNEEWARVLFHICKRRGFKSNRKTEEETDKEAGKMLTAINKNIQQLEKYRTVGEMFFDDEKFKEQKKNRGGDNYIATIRRNALEEEINILFEKQSNLKNSFSRNEFRNQYLNIFNYQKRPLSFEEILDKVGYCTLEREEKRAARNSYSAEMFQLLSEINHLRLLDENGAKIQLSEEQRQQLKELAFKHKLVKYSQIRKALKLSSDTLFVGLNYKDEKAEQRKFIEFKGYYELKQSVKGSKIEKDVLSNTALMDEIITILTFCQSDEEIVERLKAIKGLNIEDEIMEKLKKVNFTGVKHISIKAIKKLLPYLEAGESYSAACERAGYSIKAESKNYYKLPTLEEAGMMDRITNPVVIRTLSQARKIINCVIEKHGSPYYINVEVARDLKHSKSQKEDIQKNQKKNEKLNEQAKQDIRVEFNHSPNWEDIVKWRLWKEQEYRCMYSKQSIPCHRLFEPGYVQIDHIIPYSRSFDNSYNNKVLVLTDENQNKSNKIPFEYFQSNNTTIPWEEFEAFVRVLKLHGKKKEFLLKTNLTQEDEQQFKERNLNDTKYICKEISKFIRENLKFAEGEEKIRVRMVKGQITSLLRKEWGLRKDRNNGDLHHALDATVVATVSQKVIQKITLNNLYKKDGKNNEIWTNFREELIARLSLEPSKELEKLQLDSYKDVEIDKIKPIVVSKPPQRKVTGAFHEETVYSAKYQNEDKGGHYNVQKVPLNQVKYSELLYTLELPKDELIYKNLVKSNLDIYEAVRKRLEENDQDSKKAFEKPLYRKNGPQIKKIKIVKPKAIKNTMKVRNGIVKIDTMVRVDIYEKNNEYYAIPIYAIDVKKKKYPQELLKSTKWCPLDSNFHFVMSLYKNEMIGFKITDGDTEVSKMGYYSSFDRSNSNLKIELIEKSGYYADFVGKIEIYKKDDLNKTLGQLKQIKKYEVTPLGEVYEMKKEKCREDVMAEFIHK
ncbi:CRISPR-associated endonuclease Csn1 [Alkaliphilus hydrothermalis]|uniref:CRISPR-associated endonuclease Cas9 n=1 Tax=Alkaliphilus hydrothermalis TaxID=1482730 RepID=A0ABS2NS32_9FIRM|nr:CRISPR-associated endonuclease Csn1 [Alkaliphilus hydrothermalis]